MNRKSMKLIACVLVGIVLIASTTEAQKKPKKPEIPVPKRPVRIAPVDDKLEAQIKRSAFMIDQMVESNYRKQNIEPNPEVSDEVFLRRTYLNIVGRIPDYKEARSFIISRRTDKRKQLIDDLLEDPGYASHMYNYWADILRLTDRLANNVEGDSYIQWVRQCCEENKPYDEFVFEMLTAEGKIWENPAAGYTLRDFNMPLDAVNNTVRVFLGTQIGCAQCHDHPFDRWTQKDFYQMASWSYGVGMARGARDKMFGGKNIINEMREQLKTVDTNFDGGGKYNRFLIGNLREVYEINRALTLPDDYQYDDAKPKSKVESRTIFDPQPVVKPGESKRVAMARWMTSKENPRFTKTIVNRLWKQVFGLGLIEPVDEMTDETVASNPELMEYLISEMHRLDFDMKEFLRVLYNTKVYQREAVHVEPEMGAPYHFPGPVLRRMTPEQVWDSFITLSTNEPDNYQRRPAEIEAELMSVDLTSATAEEIYNRDKKLREVTGYKYRNEREKLYKHNGLLLVRASELPQPVPPGHFLRQFGLSDRESIQGNYDSGSVPQVLQMFNGPMTHLLLDSKSYLNYMITSQRTPEDRLNACFVSILSRFPTDEEKQLAIDEITANKSGGVGYGNVVWSLVNTREFLFIQ